MGNPVEAKGNQVITALESKGQRAVLTYDMEDGTTGYQVIGGPYEKGGFRSWSDARAHFELWAANAEQAA